VAAEPVAVRAQGHGAVPAGPRGVRGAHPYGAIADRSAAAGALFFNSIFYGSDLFFSGHTGMPFLAALAFWHIVPWRIFYLMLTAFFGSVVLLGHYHYSIDVLAALFITHGVFQASCWLFRRDYALFRSSETQAVPRPKRTNRKASAAAAEPGRVPKPFVLHAVGNDAVSSDQSKTGL
jgi:hypothetical protein